MLRRRLLTATLFPILAATGATLVPAAAQAADPLRIRALQCFSFQAGSNYGKINCSVTWDGGEDPSTGVFQVVGGNLRDRQESSDSVARRATYSATCWTPTEVSVTATVTDARGTAVLSQFETRCNAGRPGP
ncbi:hypothetical protein [Actinoplanes awajinensis]|nr:hypothetical protein [Actinoplanes awajinensis]